MIGGPFRHSFKVWAQDQGWPQLREVWIEADRSGFWDAVWLNDHVLVSFMPLTSTDLPPKVASARGG